MAGDRDGSGVGGDAKGVGAVGEGSAGEERGTSAENAPLPYWMIPLSEEGRKRREAMKDDSFFLKKV